MDYTRVVQATPEVPVTHAASVTHLDPFQAPLVAELRDRLEELHSTVQSQAQAQLTDPSLAEGPEPSAEAHLVLLLAGAALPGLSIAALLGLLPAAEPLAASYVHSFKFKCLNF